MVEARELTGADCGGACPVWVSTGGGRPLAHYQMLARMMGVTVIPFQENNLG